MSLKIDPEFEQALETAVNGAISDAMEPLIEEAAEKLKAQVRAKVANLAIELLSNYSLERHGDNLLITVNQKATR